MAEFLPQQNTILRVKIIVVGEEASGKTSLVQNFHGKQFQSSYNMTLGVDVLISPIKIPDSNYTVELHIFDMGGHPVFTEQRKECTSGFSAIVAVYDVTSPASLAAVSQYVDDSFQWAGVDPKSVTGVLVGMKDDLRDGTPGAVTPEAASMAANAYGFSTLTASAHENKGCDEPFLTIARACVERFEAAAKAYKEA